MDKKKKYIILSPNITNIGGAQIYMRNKKVFLEEKNWEVNIFSFREGNILIDELAAFKNNIIQELGVSPLFYSRAKRKKIFERIVKINNYDEIIIESHTGILALWGEGLAEYAAAKHIIYLLSETFKELSESEYQFFAFKHRRKELAGITKKSLEILFKNRQMLKEEEKYFLNAVCTNVVQKVDNEIIDKIEKADINLGCITRLEKSYVNGLVEEIICFAKHNPDKKIKLVIFGSSENKNIEINIKNKVQGVINLELIITGFLFPIPKKIFSLLDVFIGVAGAAIMSTSEGALTIALDVLDGKPIGILGYDTSETLYRKSEAIYSICELLENILIKQQFDRKDLSPFEKKEFLDFRNEFINHLALVENSDKRKLYFTYKDLKLGNNERIKQGIFKIIGLKRYKKLTSWLRRKD